ncbi:hypothetical protein [Pleionea sediminis]|uniref:hypothetical protein n=1 Tax=Pleionea sediminis TaxID=2569479 RepID=UPI0011871116|nr:hypothetical protein [Pleionea sediminis]
MLYLVIGIVLGAAFHEFWHDLFYKAKKKVSDWTADKSTKDQGEVVEGEVVGSNETNEKEQPAKV